MRQLHKKYESSNDAQLLIVYQKEPHPGQLAFKDVAQPETLEQRIELAKKMKEEYELPMPVLVDSMEDQSRALFSDLPSPAFVIDSEGIIQDKMPWADAQPIEEAVENIINPPKKKKRGMNPALYVAIFLPLFVVLLTAMRNVASAKKESSKTDDSTAPEGSSADSES